MYIIYDCKDITTKVKILADKGKMYIIYDCKDITTSLLRYADIC